MLLLTTLVAMLAVWGPGVVSFNLPSKIGESMCCPLLPAGYKEEFETCSQAFTPKVTCEKIHEGCEYNHIYYPVGKVIKLEPEQCMRVYCKEPDIPNGQEFPVIVMEIEHDSCHCCLSKGKLYPEGHLLNTVVQGCSRQVCKYGSWVTELDNNCCIHQEKVFFPGEVMEIGPETSECWQLWCDNGAPKKKESDCCCKRDDKIYECGEQIKVSIETCDIDVCAKGTIIRNKVEGCCVVEGKVYNNGEVVQAGVETCKDLVCDEGDVVQKPSPSCCEALEGNLYLPNQVVEKHLLKCTLKVCQTDGTIADRSIEDQCSCCELGGKLYPEGESFTSNCITLTCKSNTWLTTLGKCPRSYSYGDPHFKTFDGKTYNYNGKCNYTMLQQGKQKTADTEKNIAIHMRVCPPPFKFSTCNGDVTIKHSEHVVITITTTSQIKVNGAVVALPFSLPADAPQDALVVLDEGNQFIIITFNGFVVRYVKNPGYPAVHIYGPQAEKGKGWQGLTGTFDGRRKNDYTGRGDTPAKNRRQFLESWNTGVSEYRPDCQEEDDATKSRCTKDLKKKFNLRCKALIEAKSATCDSPWDKEGCLEDMCACEPGKEDNCYIIIKHMLEKECGPLKLTCPAAKGN